MSPGQQVEISSERPVASIRRRLILEACRKGQIDWDAALKQGNDFFDRFAAAGAQDGPPRTEQGRCRVQAGLDDANSAGVNSVEELVKRFPKTGEMKPSRELTTRLFVHAYLNTSNLYAARFDQEQVENVAVVHGLSKARSWPSAGTGRSTGGTRINSRSWYRSTSTACRRTRSPTAKSATAARTTATCSTASALTVRTMAAPTRTTAPGPTNRQQATTSGFPQCRGPWSNRVK